MALIILYMLIMFALIGGNKIVYKGAYDGLMLWFNNVIPLLLPFMLMSSLIVERIKTLPQKKQNKYAILITVFTGLLCGYPIGAKNAAEFVNYNSIDIKTGNLLLPLCNNSSPMFLSGYILLNVLNEQVSFFHALLLIYTPYVIYLITGLLINRLINKGSQKKNFKESKVKEENDHIMSTIVQITYVGFYIIICSIICEYIMSTNLYTEIKTIFAGITEITKGTMLISKGKIFNTKIKTALVLSIFSFGGISAILQTRNVIKNSGLSIISYITAKTICAFATYGLAYFFI